MTLIDDRCAIVGSANAMRRSLYTDLEHSISFVDPSDSGTTVREMRVALWSDHFRSGGMAEFGDIQKGLAAWNRAWGPTGTPHTRPAHIVQRNLPMAGLYSGKPLTEKDNAFYDAIFDADSRLKWGSPAVIDRLNDGGSGGSGGGGGGGGGS